MLDFIANGSQKLRAGLQSLADDLADAKEYGSIIDVSPVDFDALLARFEEIRAGDSGDLFEAANRQLALNTVLPLVRQTQVMAQQYDVVVTNPPYMGASGMSAKLSGYVKTCYPDSKSDLFAVFIERCGQMTKMNGYQAMITQHAWMFLSSFEKLRTKLLATDIVNMAHLGARAFEEIGGEVVQTTAFVCRKSNIENYIATYKRLVDYSSQQAKEDAFLDCPLNTVHYALKSNFSKIPGSPIAYWVSERFVSVYQKGNSLSQFATVFEGLKTRDKERFLRFWFEVDNPKWIHYAKGGAFRRWYGNGEYVVNWGKNGDEVRAFKKSSGANFPYYFMPTITYSALTSYKFSARYIESQLFGGGGGGITRVQNLYYVLAFVNSCVFHYLLNTISPTLNFEVGQIGIQPIILNDGSMEKTSNTADENVNQSKIDWDSYETSWDFKKHPLI